MSSKWASSEADRELDVQRKKEKEEKRKLKAEKQREADLEAAARTERAQVSIPPAKRLKTSNGIDADGNLSLSIVASVIEPSRSIDGYEILNRIEEGSYGYVSRAKHKQSGQIVAVKKLKVEQAHEGFPVTGLREIQTLRACSHQHIVHIREVVVGANASKDAYIVMDFLEHDLKDLLSDMDDLFSPSEVKTLMLQLTSAVEYLHSNWIIHRDLKTSNLLLNNRGEIKLADFGMARYTGNPAPRLTQCVVTLWYRAPELLLGAEEYGFEIDIWGVGCIFAELLNKEPIFQGRNEVSQLSAIFDLLGTPTSKKWPGFKHLPNAKALHPLLSSSARTRSKINSTRFPNLSQAGLDMLSDMLSMNPENRPTASEILSDQYFKEDPRPKAKEMFPTFPSRAGQERRRRKYTPQAPDRGEAPKLNPEDFAAVLSTKHE